VTKIPTQVQTAWVGHHAPAFPASLFPAPLTENDLSRRMAMAAADGMFVPVPWREDYSDSR
jgi:hypothetical protein